MTIEAISHPGSSYSKIVLQTPAERIIYRLHLPAGGSLDLAYAGAIPAGYDLYLEVDAPVVVCGSIAVS